MKIYFKKIASTTTACLLMQLLSTNSYAASNAENSVLNSYAYATGLRSFNPQLPPSGLQNQVGIDEALSYVSDLSAYWSYTSLYYYRLNQQGTFGGRINAARRFGNTAAQYQLEAYPVLFKDAYAALSIGYANTTQTLFPSYQYRAEGYFPLPQKYEFSLGQGGSFFPRFDNQKIFLYTGSIGKYMSDYYMWLRPLYFTPTSDLLMEVGVKKIFHDPNTFIIARANTGHLPDIGDLPPNDNLVTLSQSAIGIGGQFPLMCNVYGKLDLSYAHQKYDNGLVRNITTGVVGVFVQFD